MQQIEEVRHQFADLAILAAERVVRRSLDKDAHKELIEQTLSESDLFLEERRLMGSKACSQALRPGGLCHCTGARPLGRVACRIANERSTP